MDREEGLLLPQLLVEVGAYIDSPNDVTHIIVPRGRTLCGLVVGVEWVLGDETVSGNASTCRRCRWAFMTRQAEAEQAAKLRPADTRTTNRK